MNAYDWLEFEIRPEEDGLHDSGYRFIKLTGVKRVQQANGEYKLEKTDLHQWSDHVLLYGVTNIDVEPDGTIRIATWGQGGGWVTRDEGMGFFPSSAEFAAQNLEHAKAHLDLQIKFRKTLP